MLKRPTTSKKILKYTLILCVAKALFIQGFSTRPSIISVHRETFLKAKHPIERIQFPYGLSPCPSVRNSPKFSNLRPYRVGWTTRTALQMCICINCSRVTNCSAYHFVETKHEQPHMTNEPTFEPQEGSPTIHVNIRTIRNDDDRKKEIERMWREHEAETERAKKLAEEKSGSGKNLSEDLVGEETYDFSPVTTYEYDVVACEDYIHDDGCWVRNMPEEIRRRNPDFVPS